METEKIKITACNLTSGNEFELEVVIVESNTITMSCECTGKVYQGEAGAYFETFQKLRDKLLADSIGLTCYGSLINAHASVMLENVPKVYLLQMGQKPKAGDIVNMFDHTSIDKFPTTEEQIAFSQQWFDSL